MSVPMPICRTMRFKAISASPQTLPKPISSDRCVRAARGGGLRRRKAGVTQQFLDRPQIAAGAEEMGRKTVPQRVRRRRFGKTQIPADRFHLALHQTRVKRPAPCADKERTVRL